MIPVELSVLIALASTVLGLVAGILTHRAVAGRHWSAGEVRAWTLGYTARQREERHWRPAGGDGEGADRRRADVVGELAWPMEGSDRPELQ